MYFMIVRTLYNHNKNLSFQPSFSEIHKALIKKVFNILCISILLAPLHFVCLSWFSRRACVCSSNILFFLYFISLFCGQSVRKFHSVKKWRYLQRLVYIVFSIHLHIVIYVLRTTLDTFVFPQYEQEWLIDIPDKAC